MTIGAIGDGGSGTRRQWRMKRGSALTKASRGRTEHRPGARTAKRIDFHAALDKRFDYVLTVEEQRRRGREGFGFVGIWKYQLDSATKLTLVVIARSRFFTRRSGVA